MEFSCYKCSLKTICKNEKILIVINNIVKNINKVITDTYFFLNLHVLRLLEENKNIPILDQSFIQKILSVVSTTEIRKKRKSSLDDEISNTMSIYPKPINYNFGHDDYTGSIRNYLATEISTCISNHLNLNFYRRLKKYLNIRYNLKGRESYETIKSIYDPKYDGEDKIILSIKQIINNLTPNENNITKNPTLFIRLYYNMLKDYKEDRKKSFTLLPFKDNSNIHYITIDKSVIKDLHRYMCKMTYDDKNDKNDKDDLSMRRYFKLPRDYEMIKTDGKTVSILKKKEKKIKLKANDQSNIIIEDYDDIVGIDPGKKDIFVACYSKGNYTSLSSKEYYHMIGSNIINDKKKKVNKRIPTIENTNKTCNLEEMRQHIQEVLSTLDRRLSIIMKKRFREMRFTQYIKKQKALNAISDRIINNNKKVLVGFGDWSISSDKIVKGHRYGPINKIKDYLKRRCRVLDIEEAYTSKACSNCNSISMEKVNLKCKDKDGKEWFSKFRICRCTNENCHMRNKMVNRDKNASKNILEKLRLLVLKRTNSIVKKAIHVKNHE